MSQFSDNAIISFQVLLDLAGETVTVGGTSFTGVVSQIPFQSEIVDGGTAEANSFLVKLKLSDFPTNPAQYAAVVARGKTLQIQRVERYNGHIELTCIDPANE